MKPAYWDAGDRRARAPRPGAEEARRPLSGHPSAAPQRPVHDARPRDRRPADLGQGRRHHLAALRRDGRARAPGRAFPRLDRRVAAAPVAALRACGLSQRKTEYLPDLAGHFVAGRLDPRRWKKMDDEALIAALVDVQGHRPLDRRDVPHLPRAAPRRAAGRRHRPAARHRAALQRRRALSTPRRCAPSASRGSPGAPSPPGTCGARSIPCRSSTERHRARRGDVAPAAPSSSATMGRWTPRQRHRLRRTYRTPASRPTCVLDALDSVGIAATAACSRSTATRTASTRSGIEDGAPPVVAKFYRPGRWSDAQILEEHAFVAGARRARDSRWSRRCARRRRDAARVTTASASPCTRAAAAARPSSSDRDDARMDGPLHRAHPRGRRAARRSRIGPALDIATLRRRAARLAARARGSIPADLRRRTRAVVGAGARRRARAASSAPATCASLRLHGDCHAGNVLWTDDGPHFVDFDDARMGPAVQDLWMLLSGDRADDDAPARRRARRLRGLPRVRPRASCTWSRRCARCA